MLRFVAGGPRLDPHAGVRDHPSDDRHRPLHVRSEAGSLWLRGSGIRIRHTALGDGACDAFDTRSVPHRDLWRLPECVRKFRGPYTTNLMSLRDIVQPMTKLTEA